MITIMLEINLKMFVPCLMNINEQTNDLLNKKISKVEPVLAFEKKITFKGSSGEYLTQETKSYKYMDSVWTQDSIWTRTNRTQWFL